MAVHETKELLEWISAGNAEVHVSVEKTTLDECFPWRYDDVTGSICNPGNSFFRISGLRVTRSGETVLSQPIIVQDEIGYLGIIRRRIDGEMHYLMQAKIEPGNINKIQLSPTIQATKSNFTCRHGGSRPAYLEHFMNASGYRVVADRIQSEQSSRFLGKRNRNIIIEIDGDIEVLPSHRWMTMRQIKELMRVDNLVNMDTRTVLSCLPPEGEADEFTDLAMYRSAEGGRNGSATEIIGYMNDYKMFDETERRLVPLYSLDDWEMRDGEFVCREPYSFRVVFCDIEIEGREVRRWRQPLLEATGPATFGLMTRVIGGVREFLVRGTPEAGCFDRIELGPSVQREYVRDGAEDTAVDKLFDAHLKSGEGVQFDTLLSEEGGRFYHEQNRNVVVDIGADELPEPPAGYFWTDYKTLGTFIRSSNCLNIQLRNLMSVLKW